MSRYASLLATLFIINISVITPSYANDSSFSERTSNLIQKFNEKLRYQNNKKNAFLDSANIKIERCQKYPYHETHREYGFKILLKDIQDGLKQGFQCLSGNSPAGRLHPYHESQAFRLLKILENDMTKTFSCVQDKTFAYAVAKSPPVLGNNTKKDYSDEITKHISFPGIVLDTYRIGGFISDKFNTQTYRDFFKLNEEQIAEITTGKPVQLKNSHRYKNRASLVFHEMIHWLGHEHSSIHPDVTELYDMCCFGGSDHISDDVLNRKYQTQACNILKDGELWEANSYKKMQLWRYKEYDQLKRTVRKSYD